MKRTHSLRVALTTAVAIAAMSISALGGVPTRAAFAQDDAPTAIPTETIETPEASVTSEATVTVKPGVQVEPDQVTAGEIWSPPAGSNFDIATNATVIATVDAPYTFAVSGFYQIFNPSTGYGPQVAVGATLANGNRRATLSVTLNPNTIANGSAIFFQISSSDGTVTTSSPVYNLTRATRSYLPLMYRNSGASTIPNTITATGANACDASQNRRGGPLGSFVNYVVQNTSTESWFFFNNTLPGASIVVSLTNYASVQGQLQVYAEVGNGCGALSGLLGFATNPNPIVTVSGLPAGNVYFRVISGSGQPAPLPYIINWGFVGASGPFEPNNNPCQATQLTPGTQYTTFSDDAYDFFGMNITGTGQIQVLVQGFTIGFAQIQVRSPLINNNCDPVNSTNRLDPFGVVPSGGGDVLLTVFIPNPGLYYVRVSLPPNVSGNGQPYRIRWNYLGALGGDTAGPIFTSNPNQPSTCNPRVPNTGCLGDLPFNVTEGGAFTFYWFGMVNIAGGYDQLQIKIRDDITLDGCPKNVFPSDATQIDPQGFGRVWGNVGTTASRGSITFTFRKHGSYAVGFRALRGGQEVFFDEKPVRVSCGFLGKTQLGNVDARGYVTADVSPEFANEPLRPIAVFTADNPPVAKPHP